MNQLQMSLGSTTMRTELILDWRRARQQVVQQKFALRAKARFNPFRDWAGCAIAMRWQRRLQGNSSEDKTLLAVKRQRRSSTFSASILPRCTSKYPPAELEALRLLAP